MADLQNIIGLITKPLGTAGFVPTSHLVDIISSVAGSIVILTANEGINLNLRKNDRIIINSFYYKYGKNVFEKLINNLLLQTKISYNIIWRIKAINIWFFFLDSHIFILPVIITKKFRKKSVFVLAASIKESTKANNNWINKLAIYLEAISFHFADCIVLYSENLIPAWGLNRYRHKILIAGKHFLDFTTFTVTTPYPDRPPLIGYIGRLSGEKGVQHFAQALPAILSEQQDLRVLIGGDGQLKDAIEASLQERGVADRVDLPGWISHDDLPKFLNQLRLLVLPSYTEGLPNIMLEAMACGTPVLATPVGAIPDVIRDGETGFIMEDNSPECIARNVMRALNDPDLEEVAERGRKFVEGEYTFEKAVERWRGILKEICDK